MAAKKRKRISKAKAKSESVWLEGNIFIVLITIALVSILSIVNAAIILTGDTSYNSTDVNVTQEAGFAHLNLSDSAMRLYLPFDANTTTTKDYSTNNNDGTLDGTTWSSSGIIGGAYNFDGDNDKIEITNTPSAFNITNLTVSAWIKMNTIATTQGIVTNWQCIGGNVKTQMQLYIYTGKLYANLWDGSVGLGVSGATSLSTGQWYHTALVFDDSTGNATTYLNGVADNSTLIPGFHIQNPASPQPFWVGLRYCGASDMSFYGTIDEVMISNKKLSDSEISSIYNNQSSRFANYGTQTFQNINFAGNNTVNITIANCSMLKGSTINISINDGAQVPLNTGCAITGYNVTGSLNNSNLTLYYYPDAYGFYSPTINGNITLTSWFIQRLATQFVSPTEANNSIINRNNIAVNVTATTNIATITNITISFYNSTGLINSTNSSTSPFFLNFTNLADGVYYFNATAYDSEGNINSTETRTVTIDTVQPYISFFFPQNTSYNTNVSAINFTATDLHLNTCTYSTNGGAANITILCSSNLTGLTSSEGSNTWVISATDAGKCGTAPTVCTSPTNMISWWPGDGDARDIMGSNHGTLTNGALANATGKVGQAFSFDGINDYISITDSPSLTFTNSISISSWIYIKGKDSNLDVIARQWTDGVGDILFYLNSSGSVGLYIYTTGTAVNIVAPQSLNLNTWYHVFGVYNGTGGTLYTDGVNVKSGTASGNIGNPTNVLTIGNDRVNDYPFNGSIDEVEIFNRSLSSAEIQAIYNGENNMGNRNSTSVTFFKDTVPPSISGITFSPNSSADLDPGANITVNATVSDVTSSVSAVILQYHNGTGWSNATMSNDSATHYSATITLISTDANYTFNIWANDSLANINQSANNTFNSTWDCTWISTSDLGATSGWETNKFVGNITINNTGDIAYSNNNCSLDFRLTYDLIEGRIYFDGDYVKPSNTYTVTAKTNTTIVVNATFLTEILQEDVIITASEFRGRSSNSSRNITLTLVSVQSGPYLYQKITSSPASVYLTTNNFSLEGYLRNLMGSDDVNESNTAYNVSFYWELPSGFTNVSGNLTTNFTNITDSDLHYNNIGLSFSNLASMDSGVKTFSLYSQGYNLSGDLIYNANNVSLLTNSVNISFLCSNVSDGVCVTSCGYNQDTDCAAPSTTTTTTGGGGGGGGGKNIVTLATSAEYQLVRGEQNEVNITFRNPDKNLSLTNLNFTISGRIAKYVDIYPKSLAILGADQSFAITLKILSPTYIELGKQELIIRMTGQKGTADYTDAKKIILEIHELSREKAYELLTLSSELIAQLANTNISYEYLNELLNQSETGISEFNYELVKSNYEIIKKQVTEALKTNEIIKELEALIQAAEEKGINVESSSRLLRLAQLSFERKEFEQAYLRAKEAQSAYALEVKGEFGRVGYYFGKYPKEIFLAALFLVIFSIGTYNLNRFRIIRNKIKALKDEERVLNELIRVVQNECFKEKKISMKEYQTAMNEYQKKLTNTIEELIELETKKVNILSFASETRRLEAEKEKIIKLIKELQEDYLKKKKLETRTYEIKIESFNKRITEIEEKLATIEAKKAVRGLGLSIKVPEIR